MWDPAQYQRFRDERSRPFFELVARIGAESPRYVVDLGCGLGDLTATLAERWPSAEVVGVDSSEEMLAAARVMLTRSTGQREVRDPARQGRHDRQGRQGRQDRLDRGAPGTGSLRFHLGDVREFEPERPPDVMVCNAVLQWVPDHSELLSRWAGMLAADGWLAIQLPANRDQTIPELLREFAASPRWHRQLAGMAAVRLPHEPGDYLDLLAGTGCEVDAWETTYLHIMHGDDPVLEWYKGTALRPVIAALPAEEAGEFLRECAIRLRAAFPARRYGTVLPFRRIFMVAHRRGVQTLADDSAAEPVARDRGGFCAAGA